MKCLSTTKFQCQKVFAHFVMRSFKNISTSKYIGNYHIESTVPHIVWIFVSWSTEQLPFQSICNAQTEVQIYCIAL